MSEGITWIVGIFVTIALVVGIIIVCMLGFPVYNVWASQKEGEAKLAQAESVKQILVTQAQAEKDSAKLRAEAIAIVGQASKDFPEYRQQEFIGAFAEAVKEGNIGQIIYVPTEANIPITESHRLHK